MNQTAVLSETKRMLLEKYQRGALAETEPAASMIARRPLGAGAPLSLGQEQIWLHAQSASIAPAACNESITIHRRGRLDVAVLERCFFEIIRRHEAWRTTFDTVEGRPVQTVHPVPFDAFRTVDLRKTPEAAREQEALRLATKQAQQPFDLRQGPLVKALLISMEDERHRLCLTVHEGIVDGISVYQVLPRELAALYEAFSAGKPSPLHELPIQYSDFACWERGWLRGEVLTRQLNYWSNQLAGDLPVLSWPADRPRPRLQTYRGAIRSFALPEDLRASLVKLSQREGATLFMALLAAFAALLHRYTHQEDIVVGTFAPAGRKWAEVQGLLGYFRNTVALRINVSGESTFRDLLAQARDVVSGALSHDDVPFECVVEKLRLKPDPSRHPVFHVAMSLLPPIASLTPDWSVTTIDAESGGAKWDLYLQLSERTNGIIGRAQYNPDLFEAGTITRMLGHWETLLKALAANPDAPLGSAPILTDSERHQLLVEWNNTKADYPRDTPVHEMIEAQVNRTPDAVAILHEDRQMSYRLLDARAIQLGHYLRKLGAGPGVLVGVCVRRSPELVIALLGVLKSGAAYVPLDPDYPANRLSFMVNDSGLKVLVTQRALRAKFSEYHGKLVCLDRNWEAICHESTESESAGATGNDLAYVIYTSGSTGTPKGVEISHRSLVNFLVSMQSSPGFSTLDTLIAVTTVSFDIAALELYLPLMSGGRLVLVSRETAIDGNGLRDVLARTTPTVMQATPATWRLLLEAGWYGSESLKILCGGEAMPHELAGELLNRASSVWNMYGPTETTVWSAVGRITSGDAPITVGRPIANTQIYILDSRLQPAPVGVAGDLYIGGDGVARGYLHRPELTAEKFISNPFGEPGSGARLYRTGDLARYRPNGEVECLGRTDHQVKVRGFRIELGEIESALAEHPSVRQNVVWTQEDESGEKQLAAYIVAATGKSPSVKGLRDFLKQKLPDYMVPSRFTFLQALPLTPNGKVDRRALPAADLQEMTGQGEHAAPKDPIERQLVAIWEKVLRVRSIGVEDNFFDLGGHSLLVARLLRRVEDAFGKKLSMATIFDAPTVQQQASLLRNGNVLPRSSPILRVQPHGSKPPFFCFGTGAGPLFLPLARRLGSDQPLLSVDLTLFDVSELCTPYTLENFAACLVKHLREVQPEGPYYLGGVCAGGLMAYETANQLTAQGYEVGLLALFEPQIPEDYKGYSDGLRFGSIGQRLKFHIHNLRMMRVEEAQAYVRERAETVRLRTERLSRRLLNGVRAIGSYSSLQDLGDVLTAACRAYQPLPFTGRAMLFQATKRPPQRAWHRQYWKELSPMLEIHEILGYSNRVPQFFAEPTVEILANKLRGCLAEVQQVVS